MFINTLIATSKIDELHKKEGKKDNSNEEKIS